MNKFKKFKIGAFLSGMITLLPFLGMVKQLIDPTGDAVVIIILGTVVTLYFFVSLNLIYISLDKKRFIKYKKRSRLMALALLFYPFIGIVPCILLLQSTNIKNE